MMPSIRRYTIEMISRKNLNGVHLHCAAILFSKLGSDVATKNDLKNQIRQQLTRKDEKQPAYRAFISLLACYYLNDFRGLYLIKKQLEKLNNTDPLPSPVIAALLVLRHSFGKTVDGLKKELLSFLSEETMSKDPRSYPLATPDPQGGPLQISKDEVKEVFSGYGGFKAVKTATLPDLLSTAVSLYALNFTGHDLRLIKPGCLDFIDLLYKGGGFNANIIDPDPDIEYTFYGFLALGSLAD